MKERLTIISLIVLFIFFEMFIDVRDQFLDAAIPVLLMSGFVFALRFLFLTPFPKWKWLRWMIVLVLCAAFYFSFDNRGLISLIHLRQEDVCRYDLQWKESYFKSEESYQKQWKEKIDLETNFSILKNEKDILQKQCIKDMDMLTINTKTQKKLASEALEVAKWRIQDLESQC